MLRNLFFFTILGFLLFTSCKSHQDLIYFQNLQNYPDPAIYAVNKYPGTKITFGDILAISIYSFDPRAAIPFNVQPSSTDDQSATVNHGPEYLVDEEGAIDFPVLGRLEVQGLTQKEIEGLITKHLKNGYIKEPVVDVRLTNFKIVILGEAGNGILRIPNNKINIIEALAMAGDISIYGDRKNVLIIREQNGKREFARLDITDAGIFNSAYFNLQNNDIIYLEPDKYKTADMNQDRVRQSITIGTALISIITLLVTILNNK